MRSSVSYSAIYMSKNTMTQAHKMAHKIAHHIALAIGICITLVAVFTVGVAGGLLISSMLKEFFPAVISQIWAIGLSGIF